MKTVLIILAIISGKVIEAFIVGLIIGWFAKHYHFKHKQKKADTQKKKEQSND